MEIWCIPYYMGKCRIDIINRIMRLLENICGIVLAFKIEFVQELKAYPTSLRFLSVIF